MRILFATTAGAGHFGPLIPIASAAVRAGHEVAVAAPGLFEPAVREAGFDFRPLGSPSDADRGAMFARIGRASFEDANMIMARDGFFGIYARAALPAMIEHVLDWRPAVIVHESMEIASLVVAERQAIPHVQVATGLGALGRALRPVVVDPLLALFAEAGVPGDRVASAMAEPVLTLTPPSLEEPEDRGRAKAIRSDVVPRPAARGARPLVFVTLGSEAGAQGFFPGLYRGIIGMLAGMGVDLVVTVGRSADPVALEPLPPGVRVERWVDQADVLGRAAVTVFHGGYGTLVGSLAAGTPMVCIPLFSIDQRLNAQRLATVGAGLAIDGPDGIESLAGAVERVIRESGFRARAEAFAREIASLPPADEAIATLETLAG